MGTVNIAGKDCDPAQFAAAVVNSTRSLTPEQFEDDIRLIVNHVNAPDNVYSFSKMMDKLLEEHPEIYRTIPDADKRLYQLTGKAYETTPPKAWGEHTYIFVSYSLSDETIKQIIERQGERKDITLVMRGVP